MRLTRLLLHPVKEEFGRVLDRIIRHTKIVDHIAVATELLKADNFRSGKITNPTYTFRLRLMNG